MAQSRSSGIRDQLAHVFVGVNNNSQVHAVYRGISAIHLDFSLKIVWLNSGVGIPDRIERVLQPLDHVRLGSNGSSPYWPI